MNQHSHSSLCQKPPLQAHLFGSPHLLKQSELVGKSYAWHYYEFENETHQGVLIVSLKDPFEAPRLKQNSEPASVYFKIHDKTNSLKPTDYSYLFYEEDAALDFQKSFLDFLNSESTIDFCLPHFSNSELSYVITIECQPKSAFQKASESNTDFSGKHHWQVLCLNEETSSNQSTQISVQLKSNSITCAKRRFWLWDVPLQASLRSKSKSKSDFNVNYWDSNWGSESLSQFPNPWSWQRQKHSLAHAVVSYSFYSPESKCLSSQWQIVKSKEKPGHQLLLSKEGDTEAKPFPNMGGLNWHTRLQKHFRNDFGLNSSYKVTEAAPFYLRYQTKNDESFEWMLPVNIDTPIAKRALPFRQHTTNTELTQEIFNQVSRRITKHNGQSFYVASLVLGAQSRARAYGVYALCRLIDDATDEEENLDIGAEYSEVLMNSIYKEASEVPNEDLVSLQRLVESASGTHLSLLQCSQFLKGASKLVKDIEIEPSNFQDLIQGQKDDEDFQRPRNFSEFYMYCYRVAGVVGLMMAKVFGVLPSQKSALVAAEHLGIAMQITNILRDVKEDHIEKQRIYLPKDLCEKNGLEVESALKAAENSEAKPEAILELAHLGVRYYRSSLQGVSSIPGWKERFCVRAMAAIYGSILARVIFSPKQIFHKRIIVPKWKKFAILFKVAFKASPMLAAGVPQHLLESDTSEEPLLNQKENMATGQFKT